MRHLSSISRVPSSAQINYNYVLNAIGLISAFLAVFNTFTQTFGIAVPQKNNPDPMDE